MIAYLHGWHRVIVYSVRRIQEKVSSNQMSPTDVEAFNRNDSWRDVWVSWTKETLVRRTKRMQTRKSWNRTHWKIHGGFVTFYLIHFGHLKCGTHCGYPKFCYSGPGRKDYTMKLKRNSVMWLPNYLDIKENVVLRFLRLLPRRLPCLSILQG